MSDIIKEKINFYSDFVINMIRNRFENILKIELVQFENRLNKLNEIDRNKILIFTENEYCVLPNKDLIENTDIKYEPNEIIYDLEIAINNKIIKNFYEGPNLIEKYFNYLCRCYEHMLNDKLIDKDTKVYEIHLFIEPNYSNYIKILIEHKRETWYDSSIKAFFTGLNKKSITKDELIELENRMNKKYINK